jgi:hypothetical protein
MSCICCRIAAIAKLPTHAAADAAAAPIDWGRRLELAMKDQGVDLRRFVVASMDSFATRIISDVREMIRSPAPSAPDPGPAAAVSGAAPGAAAPGALSRIGWPWLAAAVFGTLWASTRGEMDRILAQVSALTAANAELKHSQQDLTDTIKDLSTALSTVTPQNALPGTTNSGAPMPAPNGSTIPAAPGTATVVRTEPVPYGEMALDRSRLEVLRELVTKLEAQGFHGRVKVTGHAGSFCLMGNSTDGYSMAPASTPLTKCDVLGNPYEDSLSGGQRQSVAFANLVASVKQRSGGAMTLTMENAGSSKAAAAYPARSEAATAADWNKAGAANNRVEISVEPGAG